MAQPGRRVMESLMTRLDAALEPRRAGEALETLKAAQVERARAALDTVRRRAKEARMRAQGRALARIDRGRSAAATGLESLVDAIRPTDAQSTARTRRRAAVLAGGSGVVLLAAVGLGLALGLMLSKRLQRKEQVRERLAGANGATRPPGLGPEPTGGESVPVEF